MRATHGDCGYSMVNTAVWATMFATGTLVMQVRYAVKVRKTRMNRRRLEWPHLSQCGGDSLCF